MVIHIKHTASVWRSVIILVTYVTTPLKGGPLMLTLPSIATRERSPHDLRHIDGPFAVIGDIHGCMYTLEKMLNQLGGTLQELPADLTLVSVGDINDKGLYSTEVLIWAIEQVERGKLIVVDSNHGAALAHRIQSKKKSKPSVEAAYQDLVKHPNAADLVPKVESFLKTRPAFVRLSGGPTGEIVVAHAGVAERLLDAQQLTPAEWRFTTLVREFLWSGPQTAIVGHVRTPAPLRVPSCKGDLIRIDTGCGEIDGSLSAYLVEEDRFISVPVDSRDMA